MSTSVTGDEVTPISETEAEDSNRSCSDQEEGADWEPEEEEAEETYVPVTLEDIPAVIDALDSKDSEVSNNAVFKLNGILSNQAELAAENLLAFDVSRLLKIAKSTEEDELRVDLIGVVAYLPTVSDDARKLIIPLIPDLVSFLDKNDISSRQCILLLLEDIADREPSSHEVITDALKPLFGPIKDLDGDDAIDEERLVSLIETFENVLIFVRDSLKKPLLDAGAFDALLSATLIKSPKVRFAAQSALARLVDLADFIADTIPAKGSQPEVITHIFSAFVFLLDDEDKEIAKAAAQFIADDRENQLNEFIGTLIEDNPKSIVALITQMARKKPMHVGDPCEYALLRLKDNEATREVVLKGFREVWGDEEMKVGVKVGIVSGLVDSFLDLRKLAFEGGLCEFVVKYVKHGSEEDAVEVLTVFDRLMTDEQMTGAYLLETAGGIDCFVDTLGSPSSDLRALSASILALTLDSYKDGESIKDTAQKALTAPNVFPRFLDALHSDDLKTVNAAANLVAEILAVEEGTKSWSYDEDSGNVPPCPLKDSVVTTELASYGISLLKRKETTVGGLHLLCQFAWGYKRGLDMLQEAFQKVVGDADVFFFEALYGDYLSRHVGRQRRVVAEAAVRAGAIPRAIALLEQEFDTVEARRAAVEGFRVLLAPDSADMDVGRTNRVLPRVMARLVGDGTLESLQAVNYMVRMLHDEEKPEAFEAWGDFVTPETVRHFIGWLRVGPEAFEEPVEEGLEGAVYRKLQEEYEKEAKKANEVFKTTMKTTVELMGNLITLLKPYSSELLGPILLRADEVEDNGSLLELLNKVAASSGGGDDVPDTLVSTIKQLFEKEPPLSLGQCNSFIQYGRPIAIAFYLGGYADRLVSAYDGITADEEEEVGHDPLQYLWSLADNVKSVGYLREIQMSFFNNEAIVRQATGFLRKKDSPHDGFQAASELGLFVKGYPEGLAILEKEDIYPALLHLYDHRELSARSVGPLLGEICRGDAGKLTSLIRKQIAGLTPPEEEAPAAGKKNGKKGKGKNKKFKPRISGTEVWERIVALVDTTTVARRALVDAGVFEYAKGVLGSKDSDDESKSAAFSFLHQLVIDEALGFVDTVAELLPEFATRFENQQEPMVPNITLMTAFIPSNIPYLVSADVPRIMFKCLADFPLFGDFELMLTTIDSLVESEVSRAPLVEAMKNSLKGESAFESEPSWGHSLGLRRMLYRSENGAKAVVEAGAVGYAVRLLKEVDLQLVTKATLLAGDLACLEHVDVRSQLLELGVVPLIDAGYAKVLEASEAKFTTDSEGSEAEAEESAHREKIKTLKGYVKHLETALKLVKGKEVKGYEPYFYL